MDERGLGRCEFFVWRVDPGIWDGRDLDFDLCAGLVAFGSFVYRRDLVVAENFYAIGLTDLGDPLGSGGGAHLGWAASSFFWLVSMREGDRFAFQVCPLGR